MGLKVQCFRAKAHRFSLEGLGVDSGRRSAVEGVGFVIEDCGLTVKGFRVWALEFRACNLKPQALSSQTYLEVHG